MVSRLGGDEFTILLECLGDSSDAGRVAQRVLEAVSRPVFVEGHEIVRPRGDRTSVRSEPPG